MRSMMLALAAAASLTIPAVSRAQKQAPQVKTTEKTPGLMARAKVPGRSAIALARRAVPNGRITSPELEEEDGKRIYSFDLKCVAGQRRPALVTASVACSWPA